MKAKRFNYQDVNYRNLNICLWRSATFVVLLLPMLVLLVVCAGLECLVERKTIWSK